MKEEAQKYREAGVTDDKLIIKAMKASRDDFGADRASNQRILLALAFCSSLSLSNKPFVSLPLSAVLNLGLQEKKQK